jgi:signal transduction histidine kinase
MSEIAFLTRHEQELAQKYDLQRRLRLVSIVASASSTLSVLIALTLTTSLLFQLHSVNSLILVMTVTTWLDIGFYGLGVIAARHGRANLAAICVCGGVMLTIGVMLVYSLVTTGFTFFSLGLLLSLPMVVVISGVLGNTSFLIIVTVLSAVVACVVPLFNAQAPVLEQNVFAVVLLLATIIITPGVMMVIFQRGYQQTLRDLGDVRIAYERASALDDLKNQFIVSVNHELRNPVMAMMGHLDILDMSVENAPRERLQKASKSAMRAAENLRALLASILDANRLEQGPGDFTPERVSVVQVIQSALQLIDPNEGSPQERELRILVPDDLCIWGEPIRLQQILTNLLSNALKYSPPGTPIEVSAQVVIESVLAPGWRKRAIPHLDRALIEITVRDWGLGILPEQIPLLFQRFVRLPRDLASNVVGNGLGLYVCRVCAEAMGGRIWVESSGAEGEGSAFHVRLPAPPVAAA